MAALRAAVARKGRGAQRRAVRQARGLEARGVRGGRAPAAEPLPAEPFEVCGVGLRPQGRANCHVAYARNYYSVSHLLVGSTVDLRVTEGARWRSSPAASAWPRTRVPVLREEPLLHARLGHARGQGVVGLGRAAHPRRASRVGPLLLRAGGQGVRLLRVRRAGLQRRARRAQAVRRYTPARLERACGMALATGKRSPRYRDVEPVLRSGAGRGRQPAGVRGLRLRARRRLLREVSMDVNAGDRPQAQGDGGRPSSPPSPPGTRPCAPGWRSPSASRWRWTRRTPTSSRRRSAT